MKCFALLLLSVCCATAQLSLQHMQPFFNGTPASSSATPITLGATYWWTFVDVTNQSKVTNWIDRISGSVWTNDISKAPTPNSTGVNFTGTSSTQLTNAIHAFDFDNGGNSTHWIVCSFTNNAAFKDYLDNGNNGNLEVGIMTGNTLGFIVASSEKDVAVIPATGRFLDIIMVSNVNGGTSSIQFYTNGIACVIKTAVAWTGGNTAWNFLGGIVAEGFFNGVIKDVGGWSSRSLTNSADVASLHNVLTNLYPQITGP